MEKNKDMPRKNTQPHGIAIALAGQAGQGIMTIERIITHVFRREGFYVFATREYMSRVRGGVNSTQIRVARTPIAAPVLREDVFVALDRQVFGRYAERAGAARVVMGDRDILAAHAGGSALRVPLPLRETAADIGRSVYANTVAAGAILALLEASLSEAEEEVRALFAGKGAQVVEDNIVALRRGYKQGSHAAFVHDLHIPMERAARHARQRFMAGYEAVALGALAGGADFCTSYPMSPSTGVLTYLAQYGAQCGMVVEQATDEIGAINMSIGAAYAGARPIVTTSGGGFALMEEAISLAGMTETPVTVHVAQRPGPATGLPTRTAQEDLNLVLHAGHGEFARAIYAPGDVAEAFVVTQRAIDDAARYQVPTFVLTDQYFVDSLAMAPADDFVVADHMKHIVRTNARYKRYALTDDGISPRGVPGHGDGYVCADSDEHDESGHITEDLALRVRMVDKRRRRLATMARVALMPTRYGARGAAAKHAFVVWGSTKMIAREALALSGRDDVTVLHFAQVYPLNPRVRTALKKFATVSVAENNATGQFATLLAQATHVPVKQVFTRYDGAPFTVEELAQYIKKLR